MIRRLSLAIAGAITLAAPVAADPLRLRGDAFAIAPAPAGLLTLEAGGAMTSWMSAEASVWMGGPARDGDAIGDALVIAIRLGRANDPMSLRVGRFVATTGALRPVHLDGLAGRLRLPRRFDVEVFAGVPVQRTGASLWDWIAGGRVSRRLGDWGSVGVAMLERREQGRRSAQELGVDAGGALGRRSDVAARVAIDLLSLGVADARITATRRFGAVKLEARVGQRSPSHLVPATSVFSVLGDVAAQDAGAAIRWRAAPRLDLLADVGARRTDDEVAPELTARATLRLDDLGTGALAAELRRSGPIGGGWIGVRGTARIVLPYAMTGAVELELVRLDAATATGNSLWPWGLVALSRRHGNWDAALAVEASASPEYRHRVDVLAQLGRRWGAP